MSFSESFGKVSQTQLFSLCHVLDGHVDVDPEHVVGDEAHEDKDGNMHPPDYYDGDGDGDYDDGDGDGDGKHGKDKRVAKMKMKMKMTMALAMVIIQMPIDDENGSQ